MNFFTSFQSVALLIALVIPGYVLIKAKVLNQNILGGLSNILLNVSLPCLIITTFVNKEKNTQIVINMGIVFVFAVVFMVASYFITVFIFRFAKKKYSKEARNCAAAAAFLNNAAFMGIPVVQSFFPGVNEALMYVSAFTAAFNLIAFTLASYVISGNKKYVSIKKAVFNPPTIVLVMALPLFLLGVKISPKIMRPFEFLGNMTTPLSMIIIGIRLACIKPKSLFTSSLVYLSGAIKLLVIPLLTFLALKMLGTFFELDRMTAVVFYVEMAMPSAALVSVFSETTGGDTETAVKCILLSSILSILTIPFLMLLSAYL